MAGHRADGVNRVQQRTAAAAGRWRDPDPKQVRFRQLLQQRVAAFAGAVEFRRPFVKPLA